MGIAVWADGLCEPVNPGGIACYGWVAYRDGRKLAEGWGVAAKGAEATNNVAEYRAVIEALEWLLAAGYRGEPVEVRSDSQLVVCQLTGEYAVRSERVRPLYRRARRLLGQFRELRLRWVPREENEEADGLSRRAYAEALVAERAERAAGLEVQPLDGFRYRVRSGSGNGWYEVDLSVPFCSCQDFARHRGLPGFRCKHLLAAEMCANRAALALRARRPV
ncbi:MAG: ribonuclease HI [Bacillota bacterium]